MGTYFNIFWENFDVNQPGAANETINGIMPESKPNLGLLSANPGTLTVAYTGSKIKSLSLNSLDYGCSLKTMEAAASTALACNITAMSYKAGRSTPVATQLFEFVPAKLVDLMNAPNFGTFGSGFQSLENAKFWVVPLWTAVALFDNVVGSTQS